MRNSHSKIQTMESKTLTDTLALKLAMSSEEVAELTDGFIQVLTRTSLDMDSVVVPAFGNFEVRKRKERVAVHPSSGKRLLVPPKLIIGFKPSAVLKNRLK